MPLITMGYKSAARVGIGSASSLAEAAEGRRVQLGDAGRRCANVACQKRLTRLNRDTLCFACQAEREDLMLEQQARPATVREILRADLRARGKQAGR